MKKIGKIARHIVDSLFMNSRQYKGMKIVALFIFLSGALFAQQPTLDVNVSKKSLAVGERFQLQYTVNTAANNFTLPQLNNFRILAGPSQSSSTQIINGKMSRSFSITYVLMALKEGQFTIPPATANADGKVIKSKGVKITVTKNASASGDGSGSIPEGSNKDLFLKAVVSKTAPYIGEQITVTYTLYFREAIVNYSLGKNPSLNGFWSQDIETQQSQRTEYIDGQKYSVADLKKMVLFPQRKGELLIDPMEVNLIVRQQTQTRSRSLFDQFFGNYQDVKKEVKSNAIKINVKELPPNPPASFKGGVGKFDMKVTASKNQVKANESIDLKIVLKGSGNLKLLENPEINLPTDFESYDPEIKDNIAVKASGVSGSRSYNYLIIPRHKGNYTIEPITFSYFNPTSRQYKTIEADPIEITVEKGDTETASPVYNNISKEDVKILGNDIKYIKTSKKRLTKKGAHFYGSLLFYTLLALPFLFFIVVMLIRNKYRNFNSDHRRVRSSKASKMAKKRLVAAKKYLEANDNKAFYEEISKALYGFAADKLNMNYGDLSKENIQEKLTSLGLGNEHITALISLLETSEMARFSPVNTASNQDVYNQAVEVIKNIENELKA